MLVEPARPQSWRSGSSRPSSGEGFTSPTELRGAAGTHRSSPGSDPPTQAGSPRQSAVVGKAAAELCRFPGKSRKFALWLIFVMFFVLSSVTESRADSAWFHVPMLVYFPGCTADTGWKFCSFPSPPPETFGVSLHLHGFHGCELLNLFRPLFHRPHVLDITFASWKAYGNDEVCLHMPFLECRWCLCNPCLILFQILLNFAFCLILQFNYIFISLHSFTIYDPYFIFESKSCKNLKE